MKLSLKIRDAENRHEVFDPARKKWVALTPEEEVRQKFILYLVNVRGIPLSHISVEHGVEVGGMVKRYDIVVFGDDFKPWMVVECKAPSVLLTEEVLNQALRYNMTLTAPFVCITNGAEIQIFSVDAESGNVQKVE